MSSSQDRASFWDHLGELRAAVLRTLALTVVCGIVAFVFKDVLFGIVLAPADPGFATYGLLSAVGAWGGDTTSVGDFSVRLINTGLARQFVVHMKAALCAGALCASPYTRYSDSSRRHSTPTSVVTWFVWPAGDMSCSWRACWSATF